MQPISSIDKENNMQPSLLKPYFPDIKPSEDKTASCPASLPSHKNVMQSSSVTPQNVAILYRDRSDLVFVQDMFGEIVSSGIIPLTTRDPSGLENHLRDNSVRSCFIMLPAEKITDRDAEFINLLCTAQRTVGKKDHLYFRIFFLLINLN